MAFAVPDSSKVAVSILLLAALTLSRPGLAQSLFEPVARDAQQAEIVDRIREEQLLNGAYSAALVGPLTALSLLYQESGDNGLAIAVLQRALQVQRANYGLRTLDQAPLMFQWIKHAETMGDIQTAWDLEQALLALAYKNPGDLRAAPILREFGDRRMDLLEQYVKGEEFAPQIILGCYYAPRPIAWTGDDAFSVAFEADQRNCSAGSRRVAIHAVLSEAQAYYWGAIQVMRSNGLYSNDELRNLEMGLVRSSYLYGRNLAVGRASLRRLLSYDTANAATLETRIESLVQIADWDLMFANGRSAHEDVLSTYEAAYRELANEEAPQASIDEIFSPKTPVVLPTFFPNPLASEETSESNGYIDVTFEIDRYGKSDGIEIIGSTSEVTDAAKKDLVRMIDRSAFRPRLTAGRVADRSPVVVRYYLDSN